MGGQFAKAELLPRVPTTFWILCTLNYMAGTERGKANRQSSGDTSLWGEGYAELHPTAAHSHSWIPPVWQPGLRRAPLGVRLHREISGGRPRPPALCHGEEHVLGPWVSVSVLNTSVHLLSKYTERLLKGVTPHGCHGLRRELGDTH